MLQVATVILFGFVLICRTRREVVDFTGVAAKNWCKGARDCTVNDDSAVSR